MRKGKECQTEITVSWTIFIMVDPLHMYMLADYIKCYIITCQYTKRTSLINDPYNKGIDQISC